MILSFKWHETLDLFVYSTGSNLVRICSPNSVILDEELFKLCCQKESLNSKCEIEYVNDT